LTKRPEIIDLALLGLLRQAIKQPSRPNFELAACAGMNTELFFQDDALSIYRAKKICQTCPIKAACGEWAMANAEFGIFGGMTPAERARTSKFGRLPGRGNQIVLQAEINFILSATAPEVAIRYGVDVRTVVRWRNILRTALDAA